MVEVFIKTYFHDQNQFVQQFVTIGFIVVVQKKEHCLVDVCFASIRDIDTNLYD